MKYEELSKKIIENVGGAENVSKLVHCSTRLRFQLKDLSKINKEGLKAIPEVPGIKDQKGGVQVIIGQQVDEVFDTINSMYTFEDTPMEQETLVENEKEKNPFVKFMNLLADCFVPLIPVLIAAGLTSAISTLISTFGWLDTNGTTYKIIDLLAEAPLYFIPFIIAHSAGKRIGVKNSYMTMAVMASLVYLNVSGIAGEETYLTFFGLPVRVATYTNSIVPALLCVFAQKYIEVGVHKITPKAVSTFLKPLLTYLVLAILMLVALGPVAEYISDGLAWLLQVTVNSNKWLVCGALGALMVPLISTGLHYSLMPVIVANYMVLGYDTFWAGPSFAANMALAGAVLGYAVITKKKDVKEVCVATGTTALLGITEPAIYSVAFVNRKVLYATGIAGGIGGLVSGILGVNSYGMAPAGLTSIPVLAGPTFVNGIITIVVAIVLGFVISVIINKAGEKNVQ